MSFVSGQSSNGGFDCLSECILVPTGVTQCISTICQCADVNYIRWLARCVGPICNKAAIQESASILDELCRSSGGKMALSQQEFINEAGGATSNSVASSTLTWPATTGIATTGIS